MGRFTQILVDLDVSLEEAPAIGARVLDWLKSNGIVADSASGNAEMLAAIEARGPPLSASMHAYLEAERGWLPGPAYEQWVDDPDADSARAGPDNRFAIDVGRTVHAFEADDETPRCPAGHEGDPDAILEAVGEWYEGDAPVAHCDTCDADWPITRWDLGEGMALGYLGLRFDDWGILKPALIQELRRLLAPHTTKLISGKV